MAQCVHSPPSLRGAKPWRGGALETHGSVKDCTARRELACINFYRLCISSSYRFSVPATTGMMCVRLAERDDLPIMHFHPSYLLCITSGAGRGGLSTVRPTHLMEWRPSPS